MAVEVLRFRVLLKVLGFGGGGGAGQVYVGFRVLGHVLGYLGCRKGLGFRFQVL